MIDDEEFYSVIEERRKQIDLSSISKEERAGVNLELGENRWLDLIKLSANS